jgi:uncharacterized membrane protein
MTEHAPGAREGPVPSHVNASIATLVELRARFDRRASRHQRAIEAITRQIGRPRTLYALVGSVIAWMVYNVAASALGGPELDPPPFYYLAIAVACYSACITTMVLTAQNRLNHDAEQRAHLELEVSLLAEQKTTKIIQLLEELRRDLPNVQNRTDTVAEAMQEEVDPKSVLAAIESTMQDAVERALAARLEADVAERLSGDDRDEDDRDEAEPPRPRRPRPRSP